MNPPRLSDGRALNFQVYLSEETHRKLLTCVEKLNGLTIMGDRGGEHGSALSMGEYVELVLIGLMEQLDRSVFRAESDRYNVQKTTYNAALKRYQARMKEYREASKLRAKTLRLTEPKKPDLPTRPWPYNRDIPKKVYLVMDRAFTEQCKKWFCAVREDSFHGLIQWALEQEGALEIPE